MSEQDHGRSGRDVDAERFVDEDVEETDNEVTSVVDLPAEGSIPDIIDQHAEIPADDEP